jgi:iron-sulfur cluster assembly accessory protein
VDRAAHLVAENAVDQLVLLDPAQAVEPSRDDLGAEVIASAGEILHPHVGVRKSLLDPRLQLVCARHPHKDSAAAPDPLPEREAIAIVSEAMVTLTDIATDKVRGFLAQQEAEGEIGLRVGVRGGGCSGFQYALALDEQRDDDHVFDHDGIRLLVDPASLQYVDGSEVDFTESLMGSGFEVNNPNVVAACGCGSSFRVADEEPSCGSVV